MDWCVLGELASASQFWHSDWYIPHRGSHRVGLLRAWLAHISRPLVGADVRIELHNRFTSSPEVVMHVAAEPVSRLIDQSSKHRQQLLVVGQLQIFVIDVVEFDSLSALNDEQIYLAWPSRMFVPVALSGCPPQTPLDIYCFVLMLPKCHLTFIAEPHPVDI